MDDDKPFVCMETGCGQRFTNEDHLSVHMRKHEMSLALNPGSLNLSSGISPSRTGGLILDQTPTPTKFLKNCEEIGLFQELNKNPFEEAFKKALDTDGEQNIIGIPGIPLPGPIGSENELNTPVPPLPRSLSEIGPLAKAKRYLSESRVLKAEPSSPEQDTEIEVVESSTEKTVSKAATVSSTTLITAAHSTTQSPPKTTIAYQAVNPFLNQSQCTMQIFLQLPNGQTVPVQIPASIPSVPVIQTSPIQTKVQTNLINTMSLLQSQQQQQQAISPQKAHTSSIAKEKLKQAIQAQTLPSPSSRPSPQMVQISPAESVNSTTSFIGNLPISSPLSVDTSLSSDTSSPTIDSTQFTPISSKRFRGDDHEALDGRRKKFLERNRAAAARCRAKRKNWINQLEKKSSDLQNNNNKLQSEINVLKTEVANLKTLLLAHKDCPVTQALQSQALQVVNNSVDVEQAEENPINLSTSRTMENPISVQQVTNILTDQALATVATSIGSVSGERTITIPTFVGNSIEHKTIRIVPAVMAQDTTKAVRKK